MNVTRKLSRYLHLALTSDKNNLSDPSSDSAVRSKLGKLHLLILKHNTKLYAQVLQALDCATTAVFTDVSLLLSLWALIPLSETLRGLPVLSSSVVSQHW